MKLVFKCGVLRLVVVMGEGWSGWGGVVVHLVCGSHTTVLHSPTGAMHCLLLLELLLMVKISSLLLITVNFMTSVKFWLS